MIGSRLLGIAAAACCAAWLAPAPAIAAGQDQPTARQGAGRPATGRKVERQRPPAMLPYLLIKSRWGPDVRFSRAPRLVASRPDALAARDDVFHRGGTPMSDSPPLADASAVPDLSFAGQSPPPAADPFLPGIEGVDPMVAVGRNFVLVSQQGKVGFFDRAGQPLAKKNGIEPAVRGHELFGAFIDPDSATDINRYNGFPKDCDDSSYPETSYGDRRFCVAEVYDLRVLFDEAGNRFIVYGALRNMLWTDAFRKSFDPGEECGRYKNPGGDSVVIDWSDRGSWCLLARRHVVIAISKTEDPRDGFHLYAITDNNYRDFPWATINSDALVIAHRGDGMPEGPVATVVSLPALRAGQQRPPYFRYYKDDVNGHERVLLPTHHGGPGGLTLMIGGKGGDQIRLFGFPPPNAQFAKPKLTSTLVDVKPMFPGVYRSGFLYFASHYDTELSPNRTPRRNIRVVRIPVWMAPSLHGPTLHASKSPEKGYLSKSFGRNGPGDAPGDVVSYEQAALAVNRHGDILIAYGRSPVATEDPLFPEVRYTVWYHDEPKQRRSNTLKKGEAAASETPAERMDYATAVVDPVDGETIWIAHEYAGPGGSYKTVVGKVKP